MSGRDGLLHRISHTPMRDWIRGRLSASLDWESVITRAGLPEPAAACIRDVVRCTRLWRSERVDVARELIAHFSDGLESGRSPVELVRAFGDVKQAAKLITRAKKRTRSTWWHAQRLLGRACMALCAAYVILAIWYFSRSPDIKRNFSRELSEAAIALPDEARAWPLYVQAAAAWPDLPEALEGRGEENYRGFNTVRAGHPKWPHLVSYLEKLKPQLDLVREGATRPALGFVLNRDDRELVAITNARAQRRSERDLALQLPAHEENPWLMGVLLPHLGEVRSWARHLQADTFLAIDQKDHRRVQANLNAIIALGEQVRYPRFLIGELVAYALFALAQETVSEIIATHPGVLTDQQIIELAHRFGAIDLDTSRLEQSYDAEAAFFDDTLQRAFADDGRGNGRLTPAGLRLLLVFQPSLGVNGTSDQSTGQSMLTLGTGPLAAMVIASREDIRAEFTAMMDLSRAYARLPLWERAGKGGVAVELERKLGESWTYRARYLPISLFCPALDKAAQSHQYTVLRRDAALTVLACESFKRRTGAYPVSAEQLVPRDLPALPVDRFDGKPLRIRTSADGSLVVYSVGANRVDDGGNWPKTDRVSTRYWLAIASGSTKPEGDWVLFPPASSSE